MTATALAQPRSPLRRVLGGACFVLAGIPVAVVAFLVLLGGWIACPLLAFTPLLPVALVAYRAVVGWTVAVDAWLAGRLLGVDAQPATGSGGSRYWGRVNAVLGDAAFWRQQGYLVQRATLGLGLGVGLLAVLGTGVNAATAFAYYRATDVEIVAWDVDHLWQALVLVPAGLAVVALGLLLSVPVGRLEGWLVIALLDPPSVAALHRAVVRRLLLLAHVAVAVIAVGVSLVVWALAGAGPFWPVWPLLALGLTVALHLWVERALVAHDGEDGARLGLAIHAGSAGAIELFLVGVWAVTGGAFWPAWTLLGLAIPVCAHLAVLLLRGARDTSALGARVQQLQSTRAAAVGAQEEHLRRLERDLHDGAQARLVALGMSLGMAEQRLEDDPDGARALVAEAREGVGAALRELRDLARGLHPPVLADRGLEAAIVSLVDAGPLPVEIDVDLPERPPVAVETAAYFVVAESIANAAKHAGAAHVLVRVRRGGTGVVVEVEDDGHGGADPAGHGLTGLRGRVEALDGRLALSSPPGGPTVVRAELPVRVVIAEDLALLRDGLERLLRDSGIEVVAAVGDATALRRVVLTERPDLAIVDIRLPPSFRDEGVRAALELRAQAPETAILVVSQYVERTYAAELLADGRGGIGYLLKDRIADVADFVDAVRRVGDGGTALDPEVVAQLVTRRRRDPVLDRLTPRELEVLSLVAEGRSNAGIAETLVLTVGAVEKHIASIFDKLDLPAAGADNRRVLAVLAYLQGVGD